MDKNNSVKTREAVDGSTVASKRSCADNEQIAKQHTLKRNIPTKTWKYLSDNDKSFW